MKQQKDFFSTTRFACELESIENHGECSDRFVVVEAPHNELNGRLSKSLIVIISIGEIEHTSNDIAGYHTKNLRNGNSMFEILHIRDIQEELKLQVEI